MNKISLFGIIGFCAIILTLTIRGLAGNPSTNEFEDREWVQNGPFELSPERGRFALTYTIAENHSVFFDVPVARFVAPDVGYHNDRYVSLFAPGVSYLTLPGYLLGKVFGLAQVGTYAIIALFAIGNVILIKAIAQRFGVPPILATVASLIFAFATPAFAYATTLYQHHISVFLILISIYMLIRSNSFWSYAVIWTAMGLSFVVDYPNLVMMAPIALAALVKGITLEKKIDVLRARISLLPIFAAFAALVPLFFLFWFNGQSYGDPTQLAGTARRAVEIRENGQPVFEEKLRQVSASTAPDEKTAGGFFQTRNLINGFYIHGVSNERGVLYFTPIMLLFVMGVYPSLKKKDSPASLLLSIIGVNVLLYSMWGDPWGGWAFGSRYLIISYALASIFLAVALKEYTRSYIFLLLFSVLAIYSIGVNTLGTVTSNLIPPRGEAEYLSAQFGEHVHYTIARNVDFLGENYSKSFVYREVFDGWLQLHTYYAIISASIVFVVISLLVYNNKYTALFKRKEQS